MFGAPAWERALNRVPNEWEEEEAIVAFCELLNAPRQSKNLWLLLDTDDGAK